MSVLNDFIANSDNEEIINKFSSEKGLNITDWFNDYDQVNGIMPKVINVSPTLIAIAFVYSYVDSKNCNLYWSEFKTGDAILYNLVFSFKGNDIPLFAQDLILYDDYYDLTTTIGKKRALIVSLKDLWLNYLEFTTAEYTKYVKSIPLK